MQEYGASKITETSLTRGDVDASYRSNYGGALTRETKEDWRSMPRMSIWPSH